MPKDERPVVYSTEFENESACPKCKRLPCICQDVTSLPPGQQIVHIRRETKGRGGKSVMVISNLTLSKSDLKQLATQLKKICNSGGTIKDGSIEIQGEHLEKILKALSTKGFKVKKIGG